MWLVVRLCIIYPLVSPQNETAREGTNERERRKYVRAEKPRKVTDTDPVALTFVNWQLEDLNSRSPTVTLVKFTI